MVCKNTLFTHFGALELRTHLKPVIRSRSSITRIHLIAQLLVATRRGRGIPVIGSITIRSGRKIHWSAPSNSWTGRGSLEPTVDKAIKWRETHTCIYIILVYKSYMYLYYFGIWVIHVFILFWYISHTCIYIILVYKSYMYLYYFGI